MSARFNVALTFGVLAVMLLTSTVIIYFTKENRDSQTRTEQFAIQAREQSEQNNRDIDAVNSTIHGFIDMWENRIKTSNTVNNQTQGKIENAVNDILGNLSSHRIVTNMSELKLEQIINQTRGLTGPEYDRLADQKVKDIVDNVTALLQQNNTR